MVAGSENDGNSGNSWMSLAQPKLWLTNPPPSGGRQSRQAIESPEPAAGQAPRSPARAPASNAATRSAWRVGQGRIMPASFARVRPGGTSQMRSARRRPAGASLDQAGAGASVIQRLDLAPGDVLRGHDRAVRARTLPGDDVAAGR